MACAWEEMESEAENLKKRLRKVGSRSRSLAFDLTPSSDCFVLAFALTSGWLFPYHTLTLGVIF